MSEGSPEAPKALVLHQQELRDVCQTLARLGIDYDERPSALSRGAEPGPRPLVVATPQRILELQAVSRTGFASTLIAVCDGLSRTLSARLSQAGVDFVLRRPVHPGALRLLLMHAFYRGPEKRRNRRVSVGAPVDVRLGWRSRPGMLLELSTGGCRVQSDRSAAPGDRIRLRLPRELTGRRPLRLRGRVVRVEGTAPDAGTGDACATELAVVFDLLGGLTYRIVADLVERHDRGPAEWKGAPRGSGTETPAAGAAGPLPDPVRAAPNRRRARRLRYAKPVLVKGRGASRVLMGRDLSSGGMRVVRDPSLSLGDPLKLALYGQDGIPPIMLQATVAREDGPFLMLRFEDPGDAGLEHLDRIMTSLPLTGADERGGSMPLVVSEVLEADGLGAGAAPEAGAAGEPPEGEPERPQADAPSVPRAVEPG